jgi:adenylosuccinate synthase
VRALGTTAAEEHLKRAIIVQGLAFGDEGKGTTVDYIVRRTGAKLVIRFNGGAQAAHTVARADGRVHTFSQFGAGTLAGARTYLSEFMMWDPLALETEAAALDRLMGNRVPRVMVDANAPVLTPWHKGLNRVRELARGAARHGSCGLGIGELADDLQHDRTVIRTRDLVESMAKLVGRAQMVQSEKIMQLLTLPNREVNYPEAQRLMMWQPRDWAERVKRALGCVLAPFNFAMAVAPYADETVVFEGAQGVLLDETHGFAPHTTWSDCTFKNAYRLIEDTRHTPEVTRVGVLRAFFTRHGAGPFPTEYDGLPLGWEVGEHNCRGEWQGAFRYGYFDAVLARYALRVAGGVDVLSLTCLDRIPADKPWPVCDAYHEGRDGTVLMNLSGTPTAEDFERWTPLYTYHDEAIAGIEKELGVRAGILSAGRTAEDKVLRRGLCPWEEVSV